MRSRPCNRCLLIVKRGSQSSRSYRTHTHGAKGRSKGKGRPCGISSTTNINYALLEARRLSSAWLPPLHSSPFVLVTTSVFTAHTWTDFGVLLLIFFVKFGFFVYLYIIAGHTISALDSIPHRLGTKEVIVLYLPSNTKKCLL